MSSFIKTAVNSIKSFLSVFKRKPKVSFGITSDINIKLDKLPTEKICLGSYFKQEKYEHCFEVILVDNKKQSVTIVDIEGKELTMSFKVFHYFFYEIAKFIPKKYVPINSKE